MSSSFSDSWQWLKDHDAPNWFVIAFSLVLWPVLVSFAGYWWYKRKIQGIPHLQVLQRPDKTKINGKLYDAVAFTFANGTGSVVYLSRVSLRECGRNFPVPPAAVKDISDGGHEIKFQNQTGALIDRERLLHTGQNAETSIAVSQLMGNEFYSYRPGLLRRLFRRPKYFVLKYTVMVGNRKYSVATIY
jgi:hypothetical protein